MPNKYFQRKTVLLAGLSFILFGLSLMVLQPALAADHPMLYLFWGKGCPHCEKEKEFLKLLQERYPALEMRWFEVWDHPEFADLGDALRKAYDDKITAVVPLTFCGDQALVGFISFEETGAQIEALVKGCLQKGCPDPFDKIAEQPAVKKIRAEVAQKKPQGWAWFPAKEGF